MGKIVRAVAEVAIVVGALVLAAPTGGLSLVGAVQALGVSAAVASALIVAGVTLIGNVLLNAVLPAPSAKATSGGGALQTYKQSISASFIIYGQRRAGGLLIFYHPKVVGKSHYRYFVIAVAGHRCQGAVQFWLNDVVVTVDISSGKVVSGDYAQHAWLWFNRGADDQQANPTFVAECDGQWTSAHRGRNTALLFAKFEMTDAVVQAGMPNMTVVVEGKDDVVDPRTGSAGYTRLATPIIYDWARTPREEGGFGLDADEVPDNATLAAWTNICDEDVTTPGGSEKRYEMDVWMTTGSAPSEVRTTFMTCTAGTYACVGGVHMLRPGYWNPVSASLHEDDLAGPITIPLLSDPQSIANEVDGTFIDPTNAWQSMPVPTRAIAAADIIQTDVDLPHITSTYRGQRILEIMLRRAQCEKKVTWPANIAALDVSALDTVQLATDRYGLSNYAFVVDGWGLSSDFGIGFQLREENEEIYEDFSNYGSVVEPPQVARAETIGNLVYRGPWAAGVDYQVNNVVTDKGSSWVAEIKHTSIDADEPPSDNWGILSLGGTGPAGFSSKTILLYQRTNASPPTPNQPVTYTFATGELDGVNEGWVSFIPAGSGPVWVTAATASAQTATDTIAANEWSAPVILSADGISVATVYLYQRAPSQPQAPSQEVVYTFLNGGTTGLNNGWARTIPAGADPIWVTQATAASTSIADTIEPSEWATPEILAQNGSPGTNGVPGATGPAGANGAPGATTYTWYAFADSIDGAVNFTTGTPSGRHFVGYAANKTTATESTTPSDYAWNPYTGPPNFGLVNGGNVTIAGNKVIKTGGSNGSWDASAYSSESWTGGASISIMAGDNAGGYMAGLNTDPTTDNSYTSIDYAWYFSGDGNRLEIWESGSMVWARTGVSGWATSDVLSIQYDSRGVHYYINGVVARTNTSVTPGLTLFADTSIRDTGRTLIISAFGAAGKAGDDGGTGATGPGGAAGADGLGSANRVKWSQFEFGTTGWTHPYTPNGFYAFRADTYQGKRYLGIKCDTTASGQQVSIGNDTPTYFPVTPGERLAVTMGLQGYGPVSSQKIIMFFSDADGNGDNGSNGRDVWVGSGGRGYDTFVGGFATVPSGNLSTGKPAVKGRLEIYTFANGGGTLDIAMDQPMVCQASSGQTILPSFTPGTNAADGATAGGGGGSSGPYNAVLTVVLAAGASINCDGQVTCGNPSSNSTLRAQLQWSPQGAGSWNSFGTSDPESIGPGEPGSSYVSGTLSNSGSGNAAFDVRLVVTGSSGPIATAASYLRAGI